MSKRAVGAAILCVLLSSFARADIDGLAQPQLTGAPAAQGDGQDTRQALIPALRNDPNNYGLILRYAYLSYLAQDYPTANEYYLRASVLGPKEQAPLEGLFYTAVAAGDPRWPEHARTLLKLDPTNREANLRLAYDEFSKRRYRSAISFYSRIIAVSDDDADALLGRGWSELYSGEYENAKADFQHVRALYPQNASAIQGLNWSPKPFSLGIGFSYAALDYRGIATKTGGYSTSFPVTIGYKKLTLTPAYIFTRINLTPPAAEAVQKEFNLSGTYALTPKLILQGAYDHISVNDPTTNNGKIHTGGATYTTALSEGEPLYVSLGGSYSSSHYPSFTVTQVRPQVGWGWLGLAYAELSTMYINVGSTGEKLSSYTGSLSLGPWNGLTLTGKDWIGYKRDAVEEGGTVVSNNQDLYRGGWKAILSWSRGDLVLFGVFGKDLARATVAGAPVNYTSRTWVAGANWKFGI